MKKSGFVVIVGRPNSGKSTLLNRLIGMRLSIVSPKAQTTRENLVGILHAEQGQICFMDTPGIHLAKDGGINDYMMSQAHHALKSPHAVWYMLSPDSKLEAEKVVIQALAQAHVPVIWVQNKADLGLSAYTAAMFEQVLGEVKASGIDLVGTVTISAETGKNVDELMAQTWALMPEGEPYYPDPEQVTDKPMKFFAAELIREQLFLQLGDEVPYSCAVEIARFDESTQPPRIEAIIYVERDSQKGIVIGAQASKIKSIGQQARASIEELMGLKIFLGLQVKLLKDWSKLPDALKRLGYAK